MNDRKGPEPRRDVRQNYVLDGARTFLEVLSKYPGTTLVEKAAALNPRAREALLPFLEDLPEGDTPSDEWCASVNKTIHALDKDLSDSIEDKNYGDADAFSDARYDAA